MDETFDQKADRMNKQFVIQSFELLLKRVLPNTSESKITEIATIAENAMTVTPYLETNQALTDIVTDVFRHDNKQAKALHETICHFAPNIMGVLMNKGMEVVEGKYTAEDFFKIPVPNHDSN